MNRNQFLILTGLSALVAFIMILQIALLKMLQHDQIRLAQSQQMITQGQACLNRLQQLATRTGQLSQSTGDQGLKDLLARQNITIAPPTAPAGTDATPANPPTH